MSDIRHYLCSVEGVRHSTGGGQAQYVDIYAFGSILWIHRYHHISVYKVSHRGDD